MLILTRKLDETICLYPEGCENDIDKMTFIKVISFQYGTHRHISTVRLGIKAPDDIAVHRLEIHRKILNQKQTELF